MLIYWLCLLSVLVSSEAFSDTKKRKFPNGFLFGAASSAFQVEGGWDVDGKSESIWDRFLHTNPDLTISRVSDTASDSYRQFQRDVHMLRELGVDFYRFSVAWTRILPSGLPNQINQAGINYYNNLIDELLKYNIEPMVTLYHYDLPQHLQDLGGWANPLSVQWFEDYANVVFGQYANGVKYWITVNQPNTICIDGYGNGTFGAKAPGLGASGIADYLCIKHVLLAHAKAYRLYEREYKKKYKGSVGLAVSVNWWDSVNNKTENVKAVEETREFMLGLFINPIWSKEGGFPTTVKDKVAKKSKEQGFRKSRLPALTDEEVRLMKGSADFLGLNHYTTFLVKKAKTKFPQPSFADDLGVELSQGPMWVPAKSPWLKNAPYGLYRACVHLNLKYDYPPMIITEHGWSTGGGLWDQSRVDNMRGYLGALLIALEDGTQVQGYTAWALMDNVEWTAGTSERFGLYEVDFESEDRKRSPRQSALVYKHIIESRVVDDEWKPTTLDIEVSERKNKIIKTEL